jgi:hypothetical protein
VPSSPAGLEFILQQGKEVGHAVLEATAREVRDAATPAPGFLFCSLEQIEPDELGAGSHTTRPRLAPHPFYQRLPWVPHHHTTS